MTERICQTCKWWVIEPEFKTRDDVQLGRCRRNAPRLTEGRDGRMHSHFPNTREDCFCGQWRDRNRVQAEVADVLTEEVSNG